MLIVFSTAQKMSLDATKGTKHPQINNKGPVESSNAPSSSSSQPNVSETAIAMMSSLATNPSGRQSFDSMLVVLQTLMTENQTLKEKVKAKEEELKHETTVHKAATAKWSTQKEELVREVAALKAEKSRNLRAAEELSALTRTVETRLGNLCVAMGGEASSSSVSASMIE